jgi:DNA (cytosine-5)-methyltransferase 1
MIGNLLDLYCCQGGASRGYLDAGFEVFGIDIDPQPRYPFWFHQGDALDVLRRLIRGEGIEFKRGDETRVMYLRDFRAIHASPPCQLYSLTHRIMKSDFPDLIGPTRELLIETGLPYVIENVVEARPEMVEPIMLCGAAFELETYRHRLFETNWGLTEPEHPAHVAKTTKMGRPVKPGEFMHVVGNFTGVDHARGVMRMPWANRDGLREAIPPAYAEWVGQQLVTHLMEMAA